MKIIWICLTFIWAAAALPLESNKIEDILRNDNPSLIEGIILGLLDDLRDTIYNGSDELPVLDPLVIDELVLNDDIIPLPGARLHLKDTTVKNLGTFDVDELSVTAWLLVNYVHLSGYIPVIDIDSEYYDLSVSALGYNVFGTGRAGVKVINPRLTADLTIQIGIISGVTLTHCDVRFTLGAFEPEVTGMFGHEGASDFVNWFLADLVPELVKFYEDEINDFLSTIVRDIVTEALP
ncbi:uncharacterized protein LOC128670296 [Plodia interpunctella]|uniref:uncharacterized protein LOC128670296 n=1 Tax=Plodia interpunctella TaxID=58824 RepID=UPI002368ABC1|nr:uncharacterized protein LOC128670296 [Plodia interpunctella]XP_053601834.1 uncharacterized protein LOC128670296 [Plodia interpunctella]